MLLVLFGTVIGVACLELGVRMMGAKPETYLRKFSQYHPVLGWVKTPDMEGEFRRGDVKIHEKMNSKGLRDNEYRYEKPEKTKRILILGDSFTEGYDVEFENIFVEILERKLNAAYTNATGLKYEVINAGTGGYSTDQEYLYYKTEGYKYHPDIVILMTYAANDIYYTIETTYGNYYKPMFIVEHDSLKLINTPLPEPGNQESAKNIFRDLALYPIALKIILTRLPSLAQALSHIGLISKSTLDASVSDGASASAKKYPSSFSIFAKEPNDKVNAAWQVAGYLIRDLNQLAQSHGSLLLVCSIPDKFQVYPESWASTKIQYNVTDSIWDPNLPDSLLKTITSKYNIPFLNIRERLVVLEKNRERLYNGVHWNVRGNEVAADIIFQELTSKSCVGK